MFLSCIQVSIMDYVTACLFCSNKKPPEWGVKYLIKDFLKHLENKADCQCLFETASLTHLLVIEKLGIKVHGDNSGD